MKQNKEGKEQPQQDVGGPVSVHTPNRASHDQGSSQRGVRDSSSSNIDDSARRLPTSLSQIPALEVEEGGRASELSSSHVHLESARAWKRFTPEMYAQLDPKPYLNVTEGHVGLSAFLL